MAGFAALLEELRKHSGLSKRQLAIKANLPPSTVGDLLQGKGSRAPRWEVVSALVVAAAECMPPTVTGISADRLQLLKNPEWWRDQHKRLEDNLQASTRYPRPQAGLVPVGMRSIRMASRAPKISNGQTTGQSNRPVTRSHPARA